VRKNANISVQRKVFHFKSLINVTTRRVHPPN
jgi:hypothetical protein